MHKLQWGAFLDTITITCVITVLYCAGEPPCGPMGIWESLEMSVFIYIAYKKMHYFFKIMKSAVMGGEYIITAC